MKITNPIIELLAIKLFEHDHGVWPPAPSLAEPSWMRLHEEDRESYRKLARGERELPG